MASSTPVQWLPLGVNEKIATKGGRVVDGTRYCEVTLPCAVVESMNGARTISAPSHWYSLHEKPPARASATKPRTPQTREAMRAVRASSGRAGASTGWVGGGWSNAAFALRRSVL